MDNSHTDSSSSSIAAVNAANLEYTHWPRNITLRLIEEYANNHTNVGNTLRSLKLLYESIATTLNTEFRLHLTGSQVSNKFQSLLRSYKTVVDNKKTGKRRKFFQFENEMSKIFNKSPNTNPNVLLSENETIIGNPSPQDVATDDFISVQNKEIASSYLPHQTSSSLRRRRPIRTEILEEIRKDKKKFYEDYIKIQNAKLIERRKRNELLKETNILLKSLIQNKITQAIDNEDCF